MFKLRAELERHIALGHNVILSDEGFVGVVNLVETLFRGIDPSLKYHLQPVVVYRRYFDWMISMYRFAYRPQWYARGWNRWNEFTDVPTFRTFYQRQGNKTHIPNAHAKMFPDVVRRTVNSTDQPCAQIINLHEGSVVDAFVSLIKAATNNNK